MKREYSLIFVITIIMYILVILLSFLVGEKQVVLLSIIPTMLTVVYVVKISKNFSNICLIFVAFTLLYGIAGPISVCFGEGIGSLYGTFFEVKKYIIAYSFSEIGVIIGITKIAKNNKNDLSFKCEELKNIFYKKRKNFLNTSIFLMTIGVVFQLINTYRCGGITALLSSKATYQALESSLFLTLPADEVIFLSFTFLSIYFGVSKSKKKKWQIVIIELIIFIPYLIIVCLLGQRGKLLSIFVIVFLGIYYFEPLKKINIKTILIIIIAYLSLSFLYANRAIVGLLQTNPQLFFEKAFSSERIVSALNPGSNEFGAAYGNFNRFITSGDYEFKYGETYLKGLVLPIPTFLYPGEKPKQITYIFRDRYFASEAKRSAIAGTGFSAILEAYWNFGYIGILIMYCIYGLLISTLEKKKYSLNIFSPIIYIYSSSVLISFSRTAFGDIFSTLIMKAIVLTLLFVIPYILTKYKRGVEKYD